MARMTQIQNRLDAYLNTITGLGTTRDKSSYTVPGCAPRLRYQELCEMYESDPIVARVVDRLVDDATRPGWQLTTDDQEFDHSQLMSAAEDIGVMPSLGDAWRWARLYGGAIAIMAATDGLPLDEPLDLSRVTSLAAIQVIEAPFVVPDYFGTGLGAASFRNPECYLITVPEGSSSNQTRKVHRSRVIRFDGMRTSSTRILENGGWSRSVVDRVWSSVKRLGSAMGYAENIMHELSVMALRMEGFRDLCSTPGGTAQAQSMIATMREGINSLDTLVLDKADEYVEIGRSVAGLDRLIDRFVDELVRATSIPRTVLLGQQAGGLANSAEGEFRAWYDYVDGEREQVLRPALARVVEVMLAAQKNRAGSCPDDWEIKFDPLWEPTAKEAAEVESLRATAAMTRISAGISSSDEERERAIRDGEVIDLGYDEPAAMIEGPEDQPVYDPSGAPEFTGQEPDAPDETPAGDPLDIEQEPEDGDETEDGYKTEDGTEYKES